MSQLILQPPPEKSPALLQHPLDNGQMALADKIEILTNSAKYDVACTSSGVKRSGNGTLGNTVIGGLCHSFSSDGRCICLLKILQSNDCIFDCKYCVNRRSNPVKRATFTPEELCSLTIEFYRRNYIEGLFLSSGIVKNPDHTMELMFQTLKLLREKYEFNGYIHVKAIPGADSALIQNTGYLADRMSVNIEMPSEESLHRLAPGKTKKSILTPMGQISRNIKQSKNEIITYNHAKPFVPAGQSTQMVIGASPETDLKIIRLSEGLYEKYKLKRVFYSAFMPVNSDSALPALPEGPPLLREHRLYQADWLLRFYYFKADEILNEQNPNFNMLIDPKCNWALNNLHLFPIEINTAEYPMLLRVPGIGVVGAQKILKARRIRRLDFSMLKKMGIVLKRAQMFITCQGKTMFPIRMNENFILNNLLMQKEKLPHHLRPEDIQYKQLSLFDTSPPLLKDPLPSPEPLKGGGFLE